MKTPKLSQWLIILVSSSILVGCEERQLTPSSLASPFRLEQKASSICGPSLDRAPLAPGGSSTPPPSGQVLSGFTTLFQPGAPPFACDRLSATTRQGLFDFRVTSRLRGSVPEPFRGAVLEILSFTPFGRGISIIDAEPWGLPFGTGFIGSSTPRNTCSFKVVRATQPWSSSTTTQVTTVDLRSGRGHFVVPFSGTLAFDVSSEVGSWWRSESAELGFAIIPDDSGINAKATNSCTVAFSVRLRNFTGPD